MMTENKTISEETPTGDTTDRVVPFGVQYPISLYFASCFCIFVLTLVFGDVFPIYITVAIDLLILYGTHKLVKKIKMNPEAFTMTEEEAQKAIDNAKKFQLTPQEQINMAMFGTKTMGNFYYYQNLH